MAKKRITLKDIARRAGISVAAVSLALKGHPRISEVTRAKVRLIAEKLQYQPDPVLSSLGSYLASSRPIEYRSTIAYLSPSDNNPSHLFTRMHNGVVQECMRQGYRCEKFLLTPKLSGERLSNILISRGIEGIIVAPLRKPKSHLRLKWEHFCAVALGHSLARPKLNVVTNYQYDSVMTAFRKGRSHGYKRIGLALTNEDDGRVNHNWTSAFFSAQRQLKSMASLPPFTPASSEWSEKNFLEWYRENKPDVIISLKSIVVDWLKRRGVKVPEEVGYIDLNTGKDSRFSGIYQNPEKIGITAVQCLVGLLNRRERGIPELRQVVFLEGTWVEGHTLPRKTAPKRN